MKLLLIVACVTWSVSSQTTELPVISAVAKLLPHMFALLDGNHDGSMSHTEFNAFITSADGNGDGCMSRQEYAALSSTGPATATKIFNYLDINHNNCLSNTSLAPVYTAMDTDGTGQVSQQELGDWFIKILTSIFGPTTAPASGTVTLPGGGAMSTYVHKTFTDFDRNGDGTFDHNEFNAFINASDTDSDGCMSRDDYITAAGTSTAIGAEIFKRFDASGSNCLNPSNLNQVFAGMDLNGNGAVPEAEFDTWFTPVLTNIFG